MRKGHGISRISKYTSQTIWKSRQGHLQDTPSRSESPQFTPRLWRLWLLKEVKL